MCARRCSSTAMLYRAEGRDAYKSIGETEFVNGVAGGRRILGRRDTPFGQCATTSPLSSTCSRGRSGAG
jgi:hypothetical protein